MTMSDDIRGEVGRFKYLGSVLQKNGCFEEDMNHRIKCERMNWREASGVLCNENIPTGLKSKFYKTVVKSAIMYRSECWAVGRKIEQRMRMLRLDSFIQDIHVFKIG